MESQPLTLDARWGVAGKLHGGYLLREIVAPLLTEAHPHPMAVSAHFVRSPDEGEATVEWEELRTGRRVGQHRARLVQAGQTCVEVLATAGSLNDREPFWTDHPAPALPPLEDCLPLSAEPPGAAFRVGIWDFLEGKGDPATFGFAWGAPAKQARLASYVRVPDRDATPADLLVVADCMPPVTLDLGIEGWVPTVELTVLVRGVPAPGWLTVVQRGRLLQDGWLDEECDVWDSRGRLVCQARQLATYRLADGSS